MAKHIHDGWSTSSDEIPQPIGVVLGSNLRQSSKLPSPPSPKNGQTVQPMSDEDFLNLLRNSNVPGVLEDEDFQRPPKDEEKQDKPQDHRE
jgi:hypothetical protein